MNLIEKKQKKTPTNKSRKNSFGRFRENSETRKATGVCPKNQSIRKKSEKRKGVCPFFFNRNSRARGYTYTHMIATSQHRGDIAQQRDGQSLSLSRCSRYRRRASKKKENKNRAISSSSSLSDSSFESTSSSDDRSLSNLDNTSAGNETLIVGVGGGEYYYASQTAPGGSPTTNTKLSIQDRLRLRSGNKFKSVVCLGCSPRAVVSNLSFDGEEEVFVDGEDVFGMHDEYLPSSSSSSSSSREGRGNRKEKMKDSVSSELMQKSAFAVEMAVRKIRSTYFAATTRENKHFLVREERDPRDGRVMHLSIREAKLSERLRRRMEKEQMSQIERMGRGFPILDV